MKIDGVSLVSKRKGKRSEKSRRKYKKEHREVERGRGRRERRLGKEQNRALYDGCVCVSRLARCCRPCIVLPFMFSCTVLLQCDQLKHVR